jgi:hypothetical protein
MVFIMSRLLASGTVVLLLANAPAAQSPPSGGLEAVAEYPPQDRAVWNLVRPGLLRLEAAQLSPAPGSVDAVRLYASTDLARMLETLRLIVDSHPQRIGPALEALGDAAFQFMEDNEATRRSAETLRQIVADARLRLPDLPREDAARAERQLIALDGSLLMTGNRGDAWTSALERFVDEYRGTEAAALAEVDLIAAGRVSQEMLDRLDAFVERHPGTTAAAKALYVQGFQWHTINTIGTIEPRGADPAPRLLRVVAIVNELESGRYPPLLTRVMTTIGGTRRQQPRQIMEVPNQPIGDSTQILTLWTAFFPARPGHWGGWELETYPVITEIHFNDADRTKAAARVTIGYSGGTVELEKVDEAWIARRLTNLWIT